jgi:hypothetical protein
MPSLFGPLGGGLRYSIYNNNIYNFNKTSF